MAHDAGSFIPEKSNLLKKTYLRTKSLYVQKNLLVKL